MFNNMLTAIGGMYNKNRVMENISPSDMSRPWKVIQGGELPIRLAEFSVLKLNDKLFVFGGITCSTRDCPYGRKWAPKSNWYGRWEASDKIFSYSSNSGMSHLTRSEFLIISRH